MNRPVILKRLGLLTLGVAAFAAVARGWSEAVPALVAAQIFGF